MKRTILFLLIPVILIFSQCKPINDCYRLNGVKIDLVEITGKTKNDCYTYSTQNIKNRNLLMRVSFNVEYYSSDEAKQMIGAIEPGLSGSKESIDAFDLILKNDDNTIITALLKHVNSPNVTTVMNSNECISISNICFKEWIELINNQTIKATDLQKETFFFIDSINNYDPQKSKIILNVKLSDSTRLTSTY